MAERRLAMTLALVGEASKSSPGRETALSSASNARQQRSVAPVTTSPIKGVSNRMRELVEIDSVAEHTCVQPSIERWEVLEPISGRWLWMRVFGCCGQVLVEPLEQDEQSKARVKRAA